MVLKDKYDVIIVGGGISGCICASKIKNKTVLIVEANDKLMKKIYATGNGRCNLTNKLIDINKYNTDQIEKVDYIYNKYNNNSFIDYLKKLGLYTIDIDGWLYPKNLQSTSVIETLKKGLKDVEIILNTEVLNVGNNYIELATKKILAKNIVLATGSIASNINRIKTNPYKLVKSNVEYPMPSLCALISSKKYFKKLSGVRVNSIATLYIDGKFIKKEKGQTQFKKDGVSGIQIFDLSSIIARNIKNHEIFIELNYIYDIDEKELYYLLLNSEDIEESISLIVPDKLAKVLCYLALRKNDSKEEKVNRLIEILKKHRIKIYDVDSYVNAQTCSGGYRLKDLDENLKVKNSNIYIIGEVLNVDGICGGYNIQWAYSSASVVADTINFY